jgi:DNA-binding transcriptional MerR regulator
MQLKFETFMPSEAETITRVTQATVRNWRRAGYLPRRKGHARYNIGDLLVMFSMEMLVSRGITLEAAQRFSGEAARAVFQSLVWQEDAFSADARDAARKEVSEFLEEKLTLVRAKLGDSLPSDPREMLEAAEMKRKLAEAAEQAAGISGVEQSEWLVIWANGEMEFFTAERAHSDFFTAYGRDEYVEGPVILFCLPALARVILDRMPRPSICLAEGED